MNFLNQQVHFIEAFKNKMLAGLLLGVFLSFIIIFLEPFDTNQYQAKYRFLLLAGFGMLLSVVFIVQSLLENKWYNRLNKKWLIIHEIAATFLFFAISGTVLFLYNHLVINDLSYTVESHWWYYSHIVVAMIPVIAPFFIFLRQKFGERIIPPSPSALTLVGENKNEELKIEKDDLLYVKSIENYIEIYFIDANKKPNSKTFRQTLANVQLQLPFLVKCHRSYLVNGACIKNIEGNSQRAQIRFHHSNKSIPLSKSFYKDIKNRLA